MITVSAIAEEGARRYAHVLTAYQGLFAGALTTYRDLVARRGSAEQAYEIALAFQRRERDLIAQETLQIAQRARERAGEQLGVHVTPIESDPVLSAHLRDVSEHHFHLVANQVERDVTALREALTRAAFEVHWKVRGEGIDHDQALARLRAAGAMQIAFIFRDRAGRRLASEKHIRTIWRHHLLTTYNEVFLHTLAEHGETAAEIAHPDPDHRWAGQEIAISGDGDGIAYGEIREAVFHPNSEAHVVAVGHSQLTDYRI